MFEGVTADVKTIVVPEGGELPPEEELAAMEAAEAEAAAAEAAAREEAAEIVYEEIEEALEAADLEDEIVAEPEDENRPEAQAEAAEAEPEPEAEAKPEES